MSNQAPKQQIKINANPETMSGEYANVMSVNHHKEEFILDFFRAYGNPWKLATCVIVSPGHLKRMISALNDNLKKYEERYGTIEEASAPIGIGFQDRDDVKRDDVKDVVKQEV